MGDTMIESLYIENFAIIDQVQIDFQSGMTVLTGETGAGKYKYDTAGLGGPDPP